MSQYHCKYLTVFLFQDITHNYMNVKSKDIGAKFMLKEMVFELFFCLNKFGMMFGKIQL